MTVGAFVHWLENALVEIYNQANKKTVERFAYMKRHYDKKTYGKPHEIGVRSRKSHTYIRKMFGTLKQNKKCHLSELSLIKYLKSAQTDKVDEDTDDDDETLQPINEPLVRITEVLPPPPPLILVRNKESPSPQPQTHDQIPIQSEGRATRSGQIYNIY